MCEDQKERSSTEFFSGDQAAIDKIIKHETARIEEVLKLLHKIKTPSTLNIGLDGSRAVWLIALHNPDYKDAGKLVLKKMRQLFYKDRNQVFYPGIPYLVDRTMLASKRYDHDAKQLYGTQGWYAKKSGGDISSERFPVINPKGLVERRANFGLATRRKTAPDCEHLRWQA